MADIGRAAGVSRGTPGYFFGHKEQLYRVVLERAGGTLGGLDAFGGDPVDALRATVSGFVTLVDANRDAVRLLDRDGAGVGAPHAEAVRTALAQLGAGVDGDAIALAIVAMAWFPVAHPDVARALGVEVDAPDFAAAWTARVLAVAEAVAAVSTGAGRGAARPPSEGADTGDADRRFVAEVVVGEKRKKKKGKKGKKDK